MQEIWKSVVGYEDLYEVSDLGRVRRTRAYNSSKKEPLKPVFDGKHYLRVSLSSANKARAFNIHRLVANAFIGIGDGMVVNHINGDKLDNRLANLEVVSIQQNEAHKWDVLKNGHSPNKKLSYEQVLAIRSAKASGLSLSEIAKTFGTCKSNVSAIVRGQTWTDRSVAVHLAARAALPRPA